MIIIMWFWTGRRLRVKFGLFGRSENSSFPSILRAWFAYTHSSPYRKSNRSDALLSFLSFRAATRNRIVGRIAKGLNDFKILCTRRGLRLGGRSDDDAGLAGDSESRSALLRCSEWRFFSVTLNFTKRTSAAKRGRVSLYAELIQSRII